MRCAEEDEMSDAWCWSLSAIDVDSPVDVRDSPIPMSIVSVVSPGSYLAERSEVWDHSSAACLCVWNSQRTSPMLNDYGTEACPASCMRLLG